MIPAILIGYAVGSLPIGYLVARTRGGVDLRRVGSGNVGTANVYRTAGLTTAVAVMIADMGKGAAAVLVAGGGVNAVAAGAAAIVGHIYPVWLGFKGGKGVATALGVFIMIAPALAFVAVGVFLVVAGRWRIPALGSLAGVSAAAIYALATHQPADVKMLAIGTFVLLLYTHRSNLSRLLTSAR